jgi:hypothetical protein
MNLLKISYYKITEANILLSIFVKQIGKLAEKEYDIRPCLAEGIEANDGSKESKP